jgi:hypothetical protein
MQAIFLHRLGKFDFFVQVRYRVWLGPAKADKFAWLYVTEYGILLRVQRTTPSGLDYSTVRRLDVPH